MQNVQSPLEIILKEIKDKGLNEKQFLINCEINTSFLNDWKSSKVKYPSYDKIIKIAQYLDLSLDYLLTGVEPLPKDLTVDEAEWLELYRKLEPSKQTEHRLELRGYVKAKEENK